MSNGNKKKDYEVGYGKPPKKNQFQKGISGNLRGRAKKSLDFSDQLIKESRAFVTISENGQKKRLSKQEVVIKALYKLAMTGNIPAARICLDSYHEALERVALSALQRSSDAKRYENVEDLTDEELMRIAAGFDKAK
jgi:hypothetical protein